MHVCDRGQVSRSRSSSAIYGPSSTLTEAAEIQFRSGAELDRSAGIVCLRPKPVNVVSGVSSLTSQCSVIVASYVKGSK